jgi:hypothetical protein
MKNSYRVRNNPEIDHNNNLTDLKNKEELLGMLGFCEPLFSAAECGKGNEEEKVSVPQEDNQLFYLSGNVPEWGPVEICLTRNAR